MEDKKEQKKGKRVCVKQKKAGEQGIYLKDDENVNAVWLEKKLLSTAPAAGARGGGISPDEATSTFHGQDRGLSGRAWTHLHQA